MSRRRRRARRNGSAHALFGFGAGAILTWLAGLVWFAEALPRQVADAATVTDGIVVLTGGSERLKVGLALLGAGRARKMFVSGVGHNVAPQDIATFSARAPDLFECCVVLGRHAQDTAGNADETARWVADEGYRSLRIVTATYHMPRSMLELRQAMPDGVFVANPVFPEHVHLERWWAWPGTASLLASEYTKFLLTAARIRVQRAW